MDISVIGRRVTFALHLPLCIFILILLASPALTCSTSGDSDENAPPVSGQFEIYFVDNYDMPVGSAIGTGLPDYFDTHNNDLNGIPLKDTPLLTVEDMLSYNWDTHTINLTSQGIERCSDIPWLQPFVVVANGERVYLGTFQFTASSYAIQADTYVIYHYDDRLSPSEIDIWPYAYSGPDARDDARIRNALDEAGVLT